MHTAARKACIMINGKRLIGIITNEAPDLMQRNVYRIEQRFRSGVVHMMSGKTDVLEDEVEVCGREVRTQACFYVAEFGEPVMSAEAAQRMSWTKMWHARKTSM